MSKKFSSIFSQHPVSLLFGKRKLEEIREKEENICIECKHSYGNDDTDVTRIRPELFNNATSNIIDPFQVTLLESMITGNSQQTSPSEYFDVMSEVDNNSCHDMEHANSSQLSSAELMRSKELTEVPAERKIEVMGPINEVIELKLTDELSVANGSENSAHVTPGPLEKTISTGNTNRILGNCTLSMNSNLDYFIKKRQRSDLHHTNRYLSSENNFHLKNELSSLSREELETQNKRMKIIIEMLQQRNMQLAQSSNGALSSADCLMNNLERMRIDDAHLSDPQSLNSSEADINISRCNYKFGAAELELKHNNISPALQLTSASEAESFLVDLGSCSTSKRQDDSESEYSVCQSQAVSFEDAETGHSLDMEMNRICGMNTCSDKLVFKMRERTSHGHTYSIDQSTLSERASQQTSFSKYGENLMRKLAEEVVVDCSQDESFLRFQSHGIRASPLASQYLSDDYLAEYNSDPLLPSTVDQIVNINREKPAKKVGKRNNSFALLMEDPHIFCDEKSIDHIAEWRKSQLKSLKKSKSLRFRGKLTFQRGFTQKYSSSKLSDEKSEASIPEKHSRKKSSRKALKEVPAKRERQRTLGENGLSVQDHLRQFISKCSGISDSSRDEQFLLCQPEEVYLTREDTVEPHPFDIAHVEESRDLLIDTNVQETTEHKKGLTYGPTLNGYEDHRNTDKDSINLRSKLSVERNDSEDTELECWFRNSTASSLSAS